MIMMPYCRPGHRRSSQDMQTSGTVGAENLVHGSDQQSCLLCRRAVMIAGHVPAVRLSPDHAGGLLAADVTA